MVIVLAGPRRSLRVRHCRAQHHLHWPRHPFQRLSVANHKRAGDVCVNTCGHSRPSPQLSDSSIARTPHKPYYLKYLLVFSPSSPSKWWPSGSARLSVRRGQVHPTQPWPTPSRPPTCPLSAGSAHSKCTSPGLLTPGHMQPSISVNRRMRDEYFLNCFFGPALEYKFLVPGPNSCSQLFFFFLLHQRYLEGKRFHEALQDKSLLSLTQSRVTSTPITHLSSLEIINHSFFLILLGTSFHKASDPRHHSKDNCKKTSPRLIEYQSPIQPFSESLKFPQSTTEHPINYTTCLTLLLPGPCSRGHKKDSHTSSAKGKSKFFSHVLFPKPFANFIYPGTPNPPASQKHNALLPPLP